MRETFGKKGANQVTLSYGYQYEYLNRPVTGSDGGPNLEQETTRSENSFVALGYGASDAWSFSLVIPHRNVVAPKTPGGNPSKQIERHYGGIGDAVVLGHYHVATQSPWVVTAGLRLPTGNANPNRDWIAADGSTVHVRDPVLQPGYGTFDPIIGLDYGANLGRYPFYAGLLGRFTGGWNRYDYKYGDELQWNLGIRFPVFRGGHTMSTGFSGVISGYDYDTFKGGKVKNTGGKWINYLFSANCALQKDMSFSMLMQVPVYRSTHGNILNSDYLISGSLKFMFSSSGGGVPTKVLRGTDRFDIASRLVHGKRTVVEFFAKDCEASRMVESPLRKVLEDSENVAWLRVDVTDANDMVLKTHGISATPDIRLFDENGVEQGRYGADLTKLQKTLGKK